MPEFLPFKALIPAKNPELVSSPPYDVLDLDECRKIAKKNPLSFIKVSRPELEMPDSINPYSEQVYQKALENFNFLKENIPFIKDKEDFYYIYRLKMKEHIQIGVAALASTNDYKENRIKKHEKTRKDKEDDRTKHILKIHSHSGPVLLTYKENKEIDEIISSYIQKNPPFIDFKAENDVYHSLWRIKNGRLTELFLKIDAFYIADGHHRAASAFRVAEEINKGKNLSGGHNYFLAVAFPANQMKILPYNRLLMDLNGKTEDDLIDFIKSKFDIVVWNSHQVQKTGQISLITKNYTLIFDVLKFKKSSKPEENLDVAILQEYILKEFFGIIDP
ncbi:MAG TPA: DUF1015 domain-containing protein, partial [Victivallales bacterium]|nr:DUF1015 domain-containing protein [Victivallales bacterium]